jgi:hypothetical protein
MTGAAFLSWLDFDASRTRSSRLLTWRVYESVLVLQNLPLGDGNRFFHSIHLLDHDGARMLWAGVPSPGDGFEKRTPRRFWTLSAALVPFLPTAEH